MKIERISENQIRCTLTREDLASRKINLRELAYGSEKAKMLFQDMMQEAFREYGFSVENSPLMIEAIPISGDAIVLIITRVDDPEELDSRFARFSHEDGGDFPDAPADSPSGLDDIINLISRLSSSARGKTAADRDGKQDLGIQPLLEHSSAAAGDKERAGSRSGTPAVSEPEKSSGKTSGKGVSGKTEKKQDAEDESGVLLTRFFLFRDLETVIHASYVTDPEYRGWNSLYKNPDDGNFYLILRMEDTTPELFNRICNVLTEYGIAVEYTSGIEEFFGEHMQVISEGAALRTLREI